MKLVKWDKARHAIAEATTIDEIKTIRDKAQAMKAYAKQIGETLEVQNDVAEIKIRAERRAGEILKETEKHKGAATPSHDDRTLPKLQDIGISYSQSSRWQATADLPEEVFEDYITETKDEKKELTSAGILRESQAYQRKIRQEQTTEKALPKGRYRILYIDPPWQYSDSGVITDTDNYGRAERHYKTLSIQELCDLPVLSLAEKDAVLFLWVTSPMLEVAFDIIKAWGFKYKTSFVWDKVKHNFGHYNSVRHEFLLICTKGSCTPDNLKLFDSVQSIERTKSHSEKPEKFREIIDTLYTKGERIELFARQIHENWEAWGDEL